MLLLNYDIELMLKIVNALLQIIPTKFDADHLESKSHDIQLMRPNRKEKRCVMYSHASVTRGLNGTSQAKFVHESSA
jgi:hypothetical protein